MAVLKFLTTKAGLVFFVVLAVAGVSATYAATRYTAELPASFTPVEATYGLAILDGEGNPLDHLNFGEIVQGEAARGALVVRNDGNVRTRLGFGVRYQDLTYEVSERCAVPVPQRQLDLLPEVELPEGILEKIRERERAFRAELGEIDSDEKRHALEKFRRELREYIADQLEDDLEEIRDHLKRPRRIVGQKVVVPGLASFCFLVTPSHPGRPPMVAPEHQVPVGVGVFTDPDVPLVEEGHNFTILVHAQDF